MKNSCLVILLCLTAFVRSSVVHAQANMYEDELKTFTGGIALGLNLAQVDGDMYFGYNKPGISSGCFVRVHFTPRLSVGMELLYTQKGSNGDAVIESPFMGTYVAKCHIGLSYVEVPVTIQYKYANFTAEAGASYARLVKTNEWILVEPSVPVSPVLNRFNGDDLEYVFGLSRKVYKNLIANIRFQYSIVSIRPTDRVPPGYAYGTKGQFNNLFCARLLYEF